MKALDFNRILLLSVIFVYYLISIELRYLWQPDETRYAEISREMLVSRDWIVPHLLGLRYFEKPPAGYWINSISQWIFGHTNFAVRFGAFFATVLTVVVVYWSAQCLWKDHRLGLTASIIFSSSLLVYVIGTYTVLDSMVTLWLAITMGLFWKTVKMPHNLSKIFSYFFVGFSCGLGFMTKGFLALILPLISIIPWIFKQQRYKEVFSYGSFVLLGIMVISSPWVLIIAYREPDFWNYFIYVEHIQRFLGDNAQHKAPFWYYFPILGIGILPWLGLLPSALYSAWCKTQANREELYLLSWTVMPLFFFTLSKGKLPTYILPCFVPLSLLIARYSTTTILLSNLTFKINGIINLIIGILLTIAVIIFFFPWEKNKTLYPLFSQDENIKVLLGILSFFIWSFFSWLTVIKPTTHWNWAALCPLGIASFSGQMIPNQVIYAKQPQVFIQATFQQLENSRFILSNSVGLATAISWELKRSDISLFENKGELAYGLSYPDSIGRFVHKEEFSTWLAEHRKEGKVSLVLLLPNLQRKIDYLPEPSDTFQYGRLVLLTYHQCK